MEDMHDKFFILAAVSLSGLIVRTVYDVLKYRFHLIRGSRFDFLMIIVMFVTWGSWLNMPKNDPVILNYPDFIRYGGLVIYIAGAGLAITGAVQIIINIIVNFVTGKNNIIDYGIYAIVRHPMYYGFIMLVIGLPLYRKGLISLVTAPLWIFFLILWLALEQKELTEKYPRYRKYRKRKFF